MYVWGQAVLPPMLGTILCEYVDKLGITWKQIERATFTSEICVHYARRAGELQSLTNVVKMRKRHLT